MVQIWFNCRSHAGVTGTLSGYMFVCGGEWGMECLTTGDGNYFLTHLFLPLIIGNNTKEQRFSLTPFVWVTIGTRLALDYILW